MFLAQMHVVLDFCYVRLFEESSDEDFVLEKYRNYVFDEAIGQME